MKTLQSIDDIIVRVSNDTAQQLVDTGMYKYVPKSVWKTLQKEIIDEKVKKKK